MASSVAAASLRALAAGVPSSLRALAAGVPSSLAKLSSSPAPFLVLLSPALPRRHLGLRSTRPRLSIAPLAASDSFEFSVEVAEPDVAEDEVLEAVAEEEPAAVLEEEDVAVEEEVEEEVGEYVEPPEEAKVYVGNLPYDIDSERLAQLFEQAGVVEVSEALAAASKTVDCLKLVHSLHAIFLIAGDNNMPIIYQVKRERDGTSFATRKVEAMQKGLVIFTLFVSFQKEELGFEHQAAIMPAVPPPEQQGCLHFLPKPVGKKYL